MKEQIVNYEDSLTKSISSIALEGSLFEDVIVSFKKTIPEAIGFIGTVVSNIPEMFQLSQKKEALIEENLSFIRRNYEKVNFVLYRDKLVSVPNGIKGNLVDYSKTVHESMAKLDAFYMGLLRDYETALSVFISSKTNNVQYGMIEKITSKVKQMEPIKKSLMEFTVNSNVTKRKLSEVIGNFRDLDELKHWHDKFISHNKKVSLDALRAQVCKIDELLKIIDTKLSEESVASVNVGVAKGLAESALQIGRLVELVSIVNFMAIVLEKVTEDLFNDCSKLFGLETWDLNF